MVGGSYLLDREKEVAMKLRLKVLQATCRGIFGLPGCLLLCCLWAVVCRAELVITEINFDPADGEGVVRPELEFVEMKYRYKIKQHQSKTKTKNM